MGEAEMMSDKPPLTSPHTSKIPERGESLDDHLRSALTIAWAELGGGTLEIAKQYVAKRLESITSWAPDERTSHPKGSDSPDSIENKYPEDQYPEWYRKPLN